MGLGNERDKEACEEPGAQSQFLFLGQPCLQRCVLRHARGQIPLPVLANLGAIYTNQGRRKEAEELEVQMMETSLRVLSAEHSDTLTSMSNLAFWKRQGRVTEAIKL